MPVAGLEELDDDAVGIADHGMPESQRAMSRRPNGLHVRWQSCLSNLGNISGPCLDATAADGGIFEILKVSACPVPGDESDFRPKFR